MAPCVFIAACSVDVHDCIPGYLDSEKNVKLMREARGDDALKIFNANPELRLLLEKFKPVSISGAAYDYSGITIRLGIAKFASADEAFGVYSGLTAMPRKRWSTGGGEMSYKNPFVAGFKGVYAFWFYSPNHPGNYFEFYETTGAKILKDLRINKRVKVNNCSYTWKLLPEENRFRDSIVYKKNEDVHGLIIDSAYSASYLSGKNRSAIYILALPGETAAKGRFNDYSLSLKNARIKTQPFPAVFAGNPCQAVSAETGSGILVVYQYRWLIFIVNNANNKESAVKHIRNIYIRMLDLKNEFREIETQRQ
jgi:hypothetical protein